MMAVKGQQGAGAFSLTRLGVLMAPAPDDPREAEGVLNPALVRGRDGNLYLFARLVAAGNYSRIGISRVIFDAAGEPAGVERLGVVLEPREQYELNPWTGGGVEDPRITFLPSFDRFLMTYTAFSAEGPRIALAVSADLFEWQRLGLVEFGPAETDFGGLHNKDAVIFSSLVPDRSGAPSLAMIHRPVFPGSASGEGAEWGEMDLPGAEPRSRQPHASIWMSYCHTAELAPGLRFDDHRRILSPRTSWERLKVGAGTPPIRTPLGWLLFYHGVSGNAARKRLRYAAGAMLLDPERPDRVIYRSPHPVLSPGLEERTGIVPNVVFPTGLDQRLDIGQPDRIDVYFGMADDRIGVASTRVPATLPAAAAPAEGLAA
jgi:predicted GH43/DUF377 family glycosyl hydrolase